MSDTRRRFAVNTRNITAKVIDGEAIIINLANGTYYSLDKTGAVAWVLIGAGHSIAETADALAERFDVAVEQAADNLLRLIEDLQEQQLIVPVDAATAPRTVELDAPTDDPYEPPMLHRYDDMGDVLALDPPLPQVEIENESWDVPN